MFDYEVSIFARIEILSLRFGAFCKYARKGGFPGAPLGGNGQSNQKRYGMALGGAGAF